MSTKAIIDAFDTWREAGDTLALATVYATDGSTYSKPGHRILIAGNGDYQGLVSGGCLEGDLAEHAKTVIAGGDSQTVTYDLRDEADELWGMGIGCNGVISVLLQRLEPDTQYEPFATIARRHLTAAGARCATVIDSTITTAPSGATVTGQESSYQRWQITDNIAATLSQHCSELPDDAAPRIVEHSFGDQSCTVLYSIIRPVPRLLILGAGPDVVPLINMAVEIGWLVTVTDHRQAYIDQPTIQAAHTRTCATPEQLATLHELSEFSAAVVMSHHLESDRAYLDQLRGTAITYIGILGPQARRDRLIDDLGAGQEDFARTLRGPVGLDIGADSPESIALSILAEIHQTLNERGR
jgi:xanthine dehydrogenase accessory factor